VNVPHEIGSSQPHAEPADAARQTGSACHKQKKPDSRICAVAPRGGGFAVWCGRP
jgi:hypothetical protein